MADAPAADGRVFLPRRRAPCSRWAGFRGRRCDKHLHVSEFTVPWPRQALAGRPSVSNARHPSRPLAEGFRLETASCPVFISCRPGREVAHKQDLLPAVLGDVPVSARTRLRVRRQRPLAWPRVAGGRGSSVGPLSCRGSDSTGGPSPQDLSPPKAQLLTRSPKDRLGSLVGVGAGVGVGDTHVQAVFLKPKNVLRRHRPRAPQRCPPACDSAPP